MDTLDLTLLNQCIAKRNTKEGPQVGDWVRLPDKTYERFAHDWGSDIQTCYNGSFYLSLTGNASMSGTLNGAIPLADIKPTQETRPARFWFFHHGITGADRGVNFIIDVPVFELTKGSEVKDENYIE